MPTPPTQRTRWWRHAVGAGLDLLFPAKCIACHGDLVHELVGGVNGGPGEVQCVHCHSTVGHGETAGLGGPGRADEIEGNAS